MAYNIIMGGVSSREERGRKEVACQEGINDIYCNFKQSNKVIMSCMRRQKQSLTKLKTQNIDQLIYDLLQPFGHIERYSWARQIVANFKKSFTVDFECIWRANR